MQLLLIVDVRSCNFVCTQEEQLKKHKARIEFLQAQNRTVNEMYQTARANEITMRRLESIIM